MIKTLIIDGHHNHSIWPTTSALIIQYLKETNLFNVVLARAQVSTGDFSYSFDDVDVVVLNYNPNPGSEAGPIWPESTRRNFEDYMKKGGGLVVVHAANNSFAHWVEFNQMTGVGGWGGRNRHWGPYVYYDEEGKLRIDSDDPDWRAGSDGPPHEYLVEHRISDHPITNGLPVKWKHCKDEIYERLRGPANNLNVLATAYSSDQEWSPGNWYHATNRHEPVLMTIDYHEGRVFHTTLGHWSYSMQCVGFITLLQRGTEWAATGKVTQLIPENFPTVQKVSYRLLEWDDFVAKEWTPYL